MKWELMYLAGLGVGFGAYALYLGYDTVVISSVFGLLGVIGGYIVGKRQKETKA